MADPRKRTAIDEHVATALNAASPPQTASCLEPDGFHALLEQAEAAPGYRTQMAHVAACPFCRREYVQLRADLLAAGRLRASAAGAARIAPAAPESRPAAPGPRRAGREPAAGAWRETLGAMLTGRFAWPHVAALQPAPQRSEGGASAAAITLLRPAATGVLSRQPLLECALPGGATDAQAFLYDVSTYEAVETTPRAVSAWRPKAGLRRGQSYEWYVTAQRAGQTLESAPARFRVADADTADALAQTAAASALAPPARGVLYAQAGLYDEAETWLRAWLRDHPPDRPQDPSEEAEVRALLRVIEQARRQ